MESDTLKELVEMAYDSGDSFVLALVENEELKLFFSNIPKNKIKIIARSLTDIIS
jgi:hypothetical protein